ncbi:unnamed protein product [Agarophyton chilense]
MRRADKVGLLLATSAVGIYFYTMHHYKRQAPGDLERTEPLPPSQEALERMKEESSSTTPLDAAVPVPNN